MTGIGKWFSNLGITGHRLFLAAICVKAIDGASEFIAGVLMVVGAGYLKHVLWLWTNNELSEEPDSTLAHHVAHAAQQISTSSKMFAAVYLVLHGVLKLGLVAGMIRRTHWIYPTAAIILTAFVGYQIYRITQQFSFVLVFLTVLDGLIALLILMEYARLRRSNAAS